MCGQWKWNRNSDKSKTVQLNNWFYPPRMHGQSGVKYRPVHKVQWNREKARTRGSQTIAPTRSQIVQTKLSTILQTKLSAIVQTKISTIVQTKIFTIVQTKISTIVQTKISTIAQTKISTIEQTRISTIAQTKISTIEQTKLCIQRTKTIAAWDTPLKMSGEWILLSQLFCQIVSH